MKDNKLIAEFMQEGSEGFNLYDYHGCHYKKLMNSMFPPPHGIG